jgi:hypothetical protein
LLGLSLLALVALLGLTLFALLALLPLSLARGLIPLATLLGLSLLALVLTKVLSLALCALALFTLLALTLPLATLGAILLARPLLGLAAAIRLGLRLLAFLTGGTGLAAAGLSSRHVLGRRDGNSCRQRRRTE